MSIVQALIGSISSTPGGGGGGGGGGNNTFLPWTVEWFSKGISPQFTGAPRIFAVSAYPNESIGFSSEGFDYAWVGGAPGISTGVSSVDGAWQHWAIVSDANYLGIFRDGTRLVYQARERMVADSTNSLYVGISSSPTTGYRGYITNFRIVKGEAMYDPGVSSLNVPAVPLVSNANTELLLKATDNGSTATDSSSRARTPWGQGGFAWSSESPFTAQGPYTQSTNIWASNSLVDFTGANYNADLLNVKAGWTVTDGTTTGTVTSNATETSPGYIRIGISFSRDSPGTWTFTQPAIGGSIQMYVNGQEYGYIGYDAGTQWALDVV